MGKPSKHTKSTIWDTLAFLEDMIDSIDMQQPSGINLATNILVS